MKKKLLLTSLVYLVFIIVMSISISFYYGHTNLKFDHAISETKAVDNHYEYTINETTYSIDCNNKCKTKDKVYYNIDNPKESIIIKHKFNIGIILSIILLCISIYLINKNKIKNKMKVYIMTLIPFIISLLYSNSILINCKNNSLFLIFLIFEIMINIYISSDITSKYILEDNGMFKRTSYTYSFLLIWYYIFISSSIFMINKGIYLKPIILLLCLVLIAYYVIRSNVKNKKNVLNIKRLLK